MTVYKLEARQTPRNNWHWYIVGLGGTMSDPTDWSKEIPCPDTCLVLVGMYHSCDSAENIAQAVFSTLYDELQTNPTIKDGDIFESPPQRVCKHHSYDNKCMLDIPAMRFRVSGVHVIRE